jgi:L-asparaginase II
LHNNCSGKHAGFVCLGCLMARQRAPGADPRAFLAGYVEPSHPVMRDVAAALEATTGARIADAPMGIDGCSIPTWGVPLRRLAWAFAKVGTGVGLAPGQAVAARRLRAAVARAPHRVAGTGRFDTRVMERLGERVFCKVGAEGVYAAALPEAGLGVAIKTDDGNTSRACEVVMAAVIAQRVRLDATERAFVEELADLEMRNWRGRSVGHLRSAGPMRPDRRHPAR